MTLPANTRIFLLIAWFNLSMLLMATDFGSVIATGGSPIDADQYGEAIWAVPALVWAGWQMGGGLLGIIGCVIVVSSDKWERHGALMAGLGNLALAALFLVFAALSRDVEKGLLLHSLSKFPGLMVSGGCAVIAFRFVIWGEE